MADGGEDVRESDDALQREIADFVKNAEITEGANIALDDVVGLSEIKQHFTEHAVLPLKFPSLFKGVPGGNVLMYGPPGVGKTMLLQAVISELLKEKAKCYRVSVYEILSILNKFPVRIMEAIFTTAKKNGKSLIIFEDIEVLCQRDAKMQDLRSMFCYHAYNTCSVGTDGDFIRLVGVTNKPWLLTFDLRRRFVYKLYFTMPNDVERNGILKKLMKSVPNDLIDEQFSSLTDLTRGFTGSDIAVLVRDSSLQPIRKVQLSTHFKKVTGPHKIIPEELVDDLLTPCSPDDDGAIEIKWTDIPESKFSPPIVCMDDFLKSLSGVKPSVTSEELQLFEIYQEKHNPV